MDLWNKVAGEFIDIIQWLEDGGDTLVYRFERYGNEIKWHARLVVREGQMAVFVSEGRLADVFSPGTYVLETKNLPVLSTLLGWKYGFESPFKAEVYFCTTRQFTDLKWGTPGPSTIRDPELGPVRVTAFGLYAMRISDPARFIREIVGTDGNVTTDVVKENLRGKIGIKIKELLPDLGIPVVELEGNVVRLGTILQERLAPQFQGLGLELTEVQVHDIGLPEELEKAIDKAGAMRAIGDLQAYTQYESANALRDAASNPGGTVSGGMGLGIGMGLAGQVAGAMGAAVSTGSPVVAPVPPPIPVPVQFHVALEGKPAGPFGLETLRSLMAEGTLVPETLVWKPGMADWATAATIGELAQLFTGGGKP